MAKLGLYGAMAGGAEGFEKGIDAEIEEARQSRLLRIRGEEDRKTQDVRGKQQVSLQEQRDKAAMQRQAAGDEAAMGRTVEGGNQQVRLQGIRDEGSMDRLQYQQGQYEDTEDPNVQRNVTTNRLEPVSNYGRAGKAPSKVATYKMLLQMPGMTPEKAEQYAFNTGNKAPSVLRSEFIEDLVTSQGLDLTNEDDRASAENQASAFMELIEGDAEGAPAGIPPEALDHLRRNPELAPQFRAKYGYLPPWAEKR